jgi:hypothetical protein
VKSGFKAIDSSGSVSASYAAVWSTNVVFCYVAPTATANTATFMTQLWWNGPHVSTNGPPGAWNVKAVPDAEKGTYRVYARGYSCELITAPELGFLVATGV